MQCTIAISVVFLHIKNKGTIFVSEHAGGENVLLMTNPSKISRLIICYPYQSVVITVIENMTTYTFILIRKWRHVNCSRT